MVNEYYYSQVSELHTLMGWLYPNLEPDPLVWATNDMALMLGITGRLMDSEEADSSLESFTD